MPKAAPPPQPTPLEAQEADNYTRANADHRPPDNTVPTEQPAGE